MLLRMPIHVLIKITQNGMSHSMGLHMLYVNNKDSDQPLRVSNFVVQCNLR